MREHGWKESGRERGEEGEGEEEDGETKGKEEKRKWGKEKERGLRMGRGWGGGSDKMSVQEHMW